MMECLEEVFKSWPHLRRMLLVTGQPEAIKLYEKTLGAVEWNGSVPAAMKIMQRVGPGLSNKH